jgi:hypothetical protein
MKAISFLADPSNAQDQKRVEISEEKLVSAPVFCILMLGGLL